jgi:hypothetical protein
MLSKQTPVTKAMRVSLWLLVVPTTLFALDALIVGLTFGAALWKARDPSPTVWWIASIGFPILLAVGLVWTRHHPKTLPILFFSGWAAGVGWCLYVVRAMVLS